NQLRLIARRIIGIEDDRRAAAEGPAADDDRRRVESVRLQGANALGDVNVVPLRDRAGDGGDADESGIGRLGVPGNLILIPQKIVRVVNLQIHAAAVGDTPEQAQSCVADGQYGREIELDIRLAIVAQG